MADKEKERLAEDNRFEDLGAQSGFFQQFKDGAIMEKILQELYILTNYLS